MHLRSLFLMGLCASFAVTSSAIAAPPAVRQDAPATVVVPVAASQQQADKQKAAARAAKAEANKAAAAKKAAEAKKRAEQTRRVAEQKKAEQARKVAAARAAEERRLAGMREAQAQRQAELSRLASADIVKTGNNGELRSEAAIKPQPVGLFAGLFGGGVATQSMLAETRALDAAMEQRQVKRRFQAKPEFEPQVVSFSGYPRGTIVIDTANHFLYLVEGSSKARRYGIAVGKDGLKYKGSVRVADKQEWPRWIPTKEMQQREPKKYGQYAEGMPGGGMNPLGARAIYLYANGKDTHLRIHGTIAPETIGTDSSNGCFRMINEHVIDLYRRVPVGTDVIVL